MRKFKRPMPLSGTPDRKCERLRSDITILVGELEAEIERLEKRIATMEGKREEKGKR